MLAARPGRCWGDRSELCSRPSAQPARPAWFCRRFGLPESYLGTNPCPALRALAGQPAILEKLPAKIPDCCSNFAVQPRPPTKFPRLDGHPNPGQLTTIARRAILSFPFFVSLCPQRSRSPVNLSQCLPLPESTYVQTHVPWVPFLAQRQHHPTSCLPFPFPRALRCIEIVMEAWNSRVIPRDA